MTNHPNRAVWVIRPEAGKFAVYYRRQRVGLFDDEVTAINYINSKKGTGT